MLQTPLCVTSAILLLWSGGCRRQSPAPAKPAPAPQTAPGRDPGPTSAPAPARSADRAAAGSEAAAPPPGWRGDGVSWTLPDGWSQTPGGGMRFMTVNPPQPGSEVAVSKFAGDVGGPLANANRWRQQLGLEPIAASDLPACSQDLQVGGVAGKLYEFENAQTGQAMVVAALSDGQSTWFFKMTGQREQLTLHRESFLALVRSVRF